MTHLSLRLRQGAPGDTVAASPLIRDLALHRPDIRISVRGTFADELFAYDPRVSPEEPPDAVPVEIDYRPTVDAARTDKTRRYLAAAHESYRRATGDPLPLTELRPSLVLAPEEQDPVIPGPYAVLAAGSKTDIPLKQHPPALFAEVVRLVPELRWVRVGRHAAPGGRIGHVQPAVPGTLDLVGQTDLRRLITVVAHARVVLCHTSLPMLLAQAFRVPCVVLGGGREDPWLHQAPGVDYLHAVGQLACCLSAGCRAVFPVPAHDMPYPPGTLCADPVRAGGLWVGRCTTLRPAAEVAGAVRAAAAGRVALAAVV